jgi:hypothetical protein
MKRTTIKSSQKKTNKINNRNRSTISRYYTGGREMPPKWKEYGHKTEAAYLEYQRERRERAAMERAAMERRERVINAVLTNVFINFIMTLIMNPSQSQRFENHIRENIRIVNNRRELDLMVDDFIHFAVTHLLDDEQILQTNRILDAVRRERGARAIANRPFGQLDILDIMEREWVRENDEFDRNSSGGNGKKKYYKHFTRKNRSSRRK